jgi:hypothetical protein
MKRILAGVVVVMTALSPLNAEEQTIALESSESRAC